MIHNLTHSTDLDGMASAALIARNLKMSPKNVIFANYSGKEFDQAMVSLSKIKGGGNLIIATDFALEGSKVAKVSSVMQKLKRNGNRIIWLDHHPWSDKAVRSAEEYCDLMIVGENISYCATELVYKTLCKPDKFGDELTRITHLADFWVRSKSQKDNRLVEKISYGMKYIRSYPDWRKRLQAFVSEIARGNLDNKIIKDAYREYSRITRPLLARMLRECTIINCNGVRFGIGFGESISNQEACNAIMEKKRCNVGIYINAENLHGSIRSKRDQRSWGLDIVPLAKSMDGGGHPLASGFSFEGSGHDVSTPAGRARVTDEIRKRITRLYGPKLTYFQQATGKTKTVTRKSHHSR